MKKTRSLERLAKRYQLNQEQRCAVGEIFRQRIVILRGAAGTGKTFVAVYAALRLMADPHCPIDSMVVTRPAVSSEPLGFLPGTLEAKLDPYLAPVLTLINRFGDEGEKLSETLIREGNIIKLPLGFMRGHTLHNQVLILDEAQNTTPDQMLTVLTRIGRGSKIIITGDEAQVEAERAHGPTGLSCVVDLAKRVDFISDIVLTINERDEIINQILAHYQKSPPKPHPNLSGGIYLPVKPTPFLPAPSIISGDRTFIPTGAGQHHSGHMGNGHSAAGGSGMAASSPNGHGIAASPLSNNGAAHSHLGNGYPAANATQGDSETNGSGYMGNGNKKAGFEVD